MTLAPFVQAPLYIQIHAACAMFALIAGPFSLYSRKRSLFHKYLGYAWMLAMIGAAVSSFWIGSFGVIGSFSPLHALSILTLGSVALSLYFILNGNIIGHRKTLTNLYWRGLIIAGIFNFLPGRTSSRAVFGENESMGLVVVALSLGLVIASSVWTNRSAVSALFAPKKNLPV